MLCLAMLLLVVLLLLLVGLLLLVVVVLPCQPGLIGLPGRRRLLPLPLLLHSLPQRLLLLLLLLPARNMGPLPPLQAVRGPSLPLPPLLLKVCCRLPLGCLPVPCCFCRIILAMNMRPSVLARHHQAAALLCLPSHPLVRLHAHPARPRLTEAGPQAAKVWRLLVSLNAGLLLGCGQAVVAQALFQLPVQLRVKEGDSWRQLSPVPHKEVLSKVGRPAGGQRMSTGM